MASATEANLVSICIKWNRFEYNHQVDPSTTIFELKQRILHETNILPMRQKLLGLKRTDGLPLTDNSTFDQLSFVKKIMLVGTPEKNIDFGPPEGEVDDIINDLEWVEEELSIPDKPENIRKLKNRISTYKVNILNPPRKNKGCLVLDIDYTLFDHRSTVETAIELMRPNLHEFLTDCYVEYDIIIWSATSYRWIELKMKELGVLSNPNYKIAFFLDSAAMITVNSPKYGVFNCKPLDIIWANFPDHYSPANTIHLDDLGRNFIMNPLNGLKVRPFKNAPLNRETDKELPKLALYLLKIISLADMRSLDHKGWESYKK